MPTHDLTPHNRPVPGRILPFDAGAEDELTKSLGSSPFRIGSDGKPSIEFRRYGRDSISVYIKSRVLESDPSLAGFSFEVGPLREESARYDLSGLEVKLRGDRRAGTVDGHVATDRRSISFFPLKVGAAYQFEFGESLGVLALPERPQPLDGGGPLRAKERMPKPEQEGGGIFAGGDFSPGVFAAT